jgi:copper chaperone CopZ
MTAPTQPIEMISFPIEGMTCASCVNRITRFLRKVDGVEEANVNLATESATIRYDGTRVDVSGLVAAVEAAGYVARVDRIGGSAAADAAAGDAAATDEPSQPMPQAGTTRLISWGHAQNSSLFRYSLKRYRTGRNLIFPKLRH